MFVKVAIYIEARLHTVHALRTALSIVSVSLAAVNAPLEGNFVLRSNTLAGQLLKSCFLLSLQQVAFFSVFTARITIPT